MNLDDIDTSDLTDDGDLLELGDRFRLRLKIEPDDVSVNDHFGQEPNVMTYGAVSKYCYDYARDGHEPRPEGFTGRARKIEVGHGYWVWWEPFNYEGEWDRKTPDEQRKEIDWITDLLQSGFVQVGLELEELVSDSLGNEHWVEIASEWVGGVDQFYPELIGQLAEEMPDIEINPTPNYAGV